MHVQVYITNDTNIGHETTSGLLSFTMLNLLKNESAYRAAQDEVDKVFGRGPVEVKDLKKLDYCEFLFQLF
jgi:cytochrome P450/NADPH-cytochrome P450 reductase